jgi:pyruvate formate lyase activating enzyme
MGNVFNIQRFSVDDGPGIRVTVFLKGCPLRCAWCHNPESHETHRSIFFDKDKCIACGYCASVCKKGAHKLTEKGHTYDIASCTRCGECAKGCFSGALDVCGKEMSAEEVITEVLKDKQFFASTGGVTLSGGEPLMQWRFSKEILKLAKENGVHTAVETCGYADREAIEAVAEYTDLFLYDIKLLDDDSHKKYTGVSNKKILENLDFLYERGANIVLRCPIIPGVNLNNEHFESLARLLLKYPKIQRLDLEPYHPLGIDKARRLGKEQVFKDERFLSPADIEKYADIIREKTDVTVKIA